MNSGVFAALSYKNKLSTARYHPHKVNIRIICKFTNFTAIELSTINHRYWKVWIYYEKCINAPRKRSWKWFWQMQPASPLCSREVFCTEQTYRTDHVQY